MTPSCCNYGEFKCVSVKLTDQYHLFLNGYFLNITNKQLCVKEMSFIHVSTLTHPSNHPKIAKLSKKVIFSTHFVVTKVLYPP